MSENLHDDQHFGVYGLSNDQGAAARRASLAADFEAQVAAKRAARAAAEAASVATQADESGVRADASARSVVYDPIHEARVKAAQAEAAREATQIKSQTPPPCVPPVAFNKPTDACACDVPVRDEACVDAPCAEDSLPGVVDERVFSERVAYADVKHMSKNFYKGLAASAVVVVIVVVIIMVLSKFMA